MQNLARSFISKYNLQESFYIVDLKTLASKIHEWNSHLPNIQPFYALKCNPDRQMINVMIKNGLGFDAASRYEIDHVLRCGGKSDNIIFAHPVKKPCDIEYAVANNIQYTTFDSFCELEKIKEYAPNIKCMIRLRIDNPSARVQLGMKYGVASDEFRYLIDQAKKMNLNLAGTSFHVGSASTNPTVFNDAIEYSREVFKYAKSRGYMMNILDVGGGFTKETFVDSAKVLNAAISRDFNDASIKKIAEPGRYFAEEVFTFVTPVIGKRERNDKKEYWITDGLYGSFNCILYDDQTPSFSIIRKNDGCINEPITYDSVIYGSTCDSRDTIGTYKLPMFDVGDYLMIQNFGAYTLAGANNFNGINMMNPKMFYIC
jgi:ornithine decarboxylase